MKACKTCLIEKLDTEFSERENGKLRNDCKICRSKKHQEYYINNKDTRKKNAKTWRDKNKERDKVAKQNYINTPKGRVIKLSRAAKQRAIEYKKEFNINTQYLMQLWNLQNGRCALTNKTFEFQNTTKYETNPWAPSIDRIDSTKGYIVGNIRFVCVAVNYALNEFGEEVFRQICEAYLNSIVHIN